MLKKTMPARALGPLGCVAIAMSFAFVTAQTASAQMTCPSGMVNYWTFDDGTIEGNTAYDVVGGNHATITGAISDSGRVGGALSFDGNDHALTNSDISITGNQPRTMEFWAKTDNLTSTPITQPVLWWGGLSTARLNLITFGNSGNTAFSTAIFFGFYRDVLGETALLPDEWTHVAVTYDGTHIRIYINGVSGAASPQALNTTASRMTMGYYPGWPSYYIGEVDEIAIYDRALTAAEIQGHYQSGLMGYGYCMPDTDGDGIGDDFDACAATPPGEELVRGCSASQMSGSDDADGDGATDDADACPGTDPELEPYRPIAEGCSCYQILEMKPGADKGEMKNGCSNGTLGGFLNRKGWAKDIPRPGQ
ncbi:MAG: LamG domain-containing protein [Elusimicrobiota bacterium]